MSKMRAPSPQDLRFAAEWLRQYDDSHEGGGQTKTAESVAEWLDEQAQAQEMRDTAKELGVPVSQVRAAIAKLGASA